LRDAVDAVADRVSSARRHSENKAAALGERGCNFATALKMTQDATQAFPEVGKDLQIRLAAVKPIGTAS
jgi:hypothetical protein